MVSYSHLKNNLVLTKVRTKHKYKCFRYYKHKKLKVANSKKTPISKKEYERLKRLFGK
jgi:hypothetical protein